MVSKMSQVHNTAEKHKHKGGEAIDLPVCFDSQGPLTTSGKSLSCAETTCPQLMVYVLMRNNFNLLQCQISINH